MPRWCCGRSSPMRKLGCLGLLIALAAILGVFLVAQSWSGAGPAEKTVTVVVPQGATLTRAADQLEAAGAIGSARRFLLLAKVFGGSAPIKAGEYRLPAHVRQSDILSAMQNGKTLQRLVTIPEGLPSIRSEERRVGKECGSPGRSRWWPDT